MRQPSHTPIQYLFITAFVLFFVYLLLMRLPVLPNEVLGFSAQKLLKIILGFAFCVSSIVIYLTAKDNHHGSGR